MLHFVVVGSGGGGQWRGRIIKGTFATSILTFCLGSFNFWVSGAFLHFLGSLLPLENLLWTPMLQVFFIISFEVAKIIKLVGKHYQDISGESYY